MEKNKKTCDHHHHGVSFRELSAGNRQKMQRRLTLTIWINVFITLMEVVIGVWAGSMALLTDALHNFSDVLALVLSLVGLYLLNRKAHNEQTFGFQRVELVIGLVNAISLIFIGLFALYSGVGFFIQHVVNYFKGVGDSHDMLGLPIFIASLVSVILNGLCVYILEKGEHQSISTQSAMLHLFADMLTSVAVCVAGVMIYFFKMYWIDAFISILIAFYIIFSSFKLGKYSIQILLNFNVTGLQIKDISAKLCEQPQVHSISHIHLWSLSESMVMLEAHVGVPQDFSVKEIAQLNEQIKEILVQEFHIDHVTLEFHPSGKGKQKCQFL